MRSELVPDLFPELIVRAGSDEDVQGAVVRAASDGLSVAARSSGHASLPHALLPPGGVVVDVSGLASVCVDVMARRATVGPGVTTAQLAVALGKHGLAFPVGHCPTVALGGYLLGGGLGWNSGLWGPGCMRVEAVKVVTESGELVAADEDHNQDLLWLARGAGPLFPGVVTELTLTVEPAPRTVLCGHWVLALDDVDAIAAWLAELEQVLDPAVEIQIYLTTEPRAIDVTATAFAGSIDAARSLMAPVERHQCRALDATPPHERPFAELARDGLLGDYDEPGYRYGGDTASTRADLGTVFVALAEHLERAPSRDSVLGCHPSYLRVGWGREASGGAYSMTGSVLATAYTKWRDPDDDERNAHWAREAVAAGIASAPCEYFIAQADLTADDARVSQCFSPQSWKRLCALRPQFDDERFWTGLGPNPSVVSPTTARGE